MTPGSVSIAVLDDEAKFRQAIGRLLRSHGFKVEAFGTGTELLEALKTRRFDCVLLDLHMAEVSGFDVLSEVGQRQVDTPIIVITGHDEPGNGDRVTAWGPPITCLSQSMSCRCWRRLPKPFQGFNSQI